MSSLPNFYPFLSWLNRNIPSIFMLGTNLMQLEWRNSSLFLWATPWQVLKHHFLSHLTKNLYKQSWMLSSYCQIRLHKQGLLAMVHLKRIGMRLWEFGHASSNRYLLVSSYKSLVLLKLARYLSNLFLSNRRPTNSRSLWALSTDSFSQLKQSFHSNFTFNLKQFIYK